MSARSSSAPGPDVRPATADDVPALATMFAAAFDGYPWTRWVVDPAGHGDRLRGLYAVYLDVALRFGEVWAAADASGAAAWTWSGTGDDQARHLGETGLGRRVAELAGDRLDAALRAEAALAPLRLRDPHWQLQALGVAPGRRNQGLGTRLLEPVLERCDAEGLVAALETSSPDNVRLYRRLGFEVHAEAAMPDGPRVWLMERRPR